MAGAQRRRLGAEPASTSGPRRSLRAGSPEALEALRSLGPLSLGAAARQAGLSLDISGLCPASTAAQVQVHAGPRHPRGLRGRDRHPPALHDRRRPGRRRHRRRLLPAAGARLRDRARSSKSTPTPGRRVGPIDMFPDNNYVPAVITHHPRDRRGRQDHRVRAQAQPRDRHRQGRSRHPVHRDLHPLRPPRLPRALGRCRRALHLPLPRRRLRPARSPRRRAPSPAARPLLHPRARRPGPGRRRATASTASSNASPRATPASPSTGSGSTCTPRGPPHRSSP